MRRVASILVALSGVLLGAASALAADTGPVIVVPGRLGAPVFIDGVDVSGAVIEGEFGLNKPQMVAPKIIWAPFWRPQRSYLEDSYFPATGREPGYGRYEIVPPADRRLPPPAPSFHRSWSSQSESLPANVDPPAQSTPIVVAPQIYPQVPNGPPAAANATVKHVSIVHQPGLDRTRPLQRGANMFRPSFYLFGFGALTLAAAVTPAAAGACCACATACLPYGPVQVWGPAPYRSYYMVNQGPDYSGNFVTTLPTIDAEGPPADYPYVQGYFNPYPVAPNYRPYGGGYSAYPHRTGLLYRHGYGPRALTVSAGEHWGPRSRRFFGEPRVR